MPITIVITGGPCAGKSTIFKKVAEHCSQLGYKVYSLPESATIFMESGVEFVTPDKHLSFITESEKLRFQLAMEDCVGTIAQQFGHPSVIVLDRGSMDTFAYTSAEMKSAIMEKIGKSEYELRDERYDIVLHICTAAKGAEESYTQANNIHRRESSIELARDVDDRTLAAWKGSPNYRIINAEINFEDKINNVIRTVDEMMSSLKQQSK